MTTSKFKPSSAFPTEKALRAYLLRFECQTKKSPYPLANSRTTLTKYLELETWTPEQAASLVAGIDPDTIQPDEIACSLSSLHLDGIDAFVSGMEVYAAMNGACVAANAVRIQQEGGSMFQKRAQILRLWNSQLNPSEKVHSAEFVTWCKSKNIDTTWLAAASLAAKVKAATSPSGDDWITKARAFADREAVTRYARGEREITARNICEAVATELAKDSTTHGTRGERASGSIRSVALKGWKFIPPTGTNGTIGTKK